MATQIELGGIILDVVKKDIKNVHLSVYPPNGKVRIAAPLHMDPDAIRVFAISKLEWIRRQQQTLHAQERETPREYLDRESHFVWGKRYLLNVIEKHSAPRVQLKHSTLVLQVRPGSTDEKKHAVLEHWYREQLRAAASPLIERYEGLMKVKVERLFVQRMRTKWGSCSRESRSIRLNSELARKPRECLEYIVVHEMAHLLEPTHNERFVSLMNRFMPEWQFHRDTLNALPVRHEHWVD
jgi:predicted metal-dependent hydrolase